MTGNRVKFGLTLPNRGVVIGATTVAEMLQLAADAESAGWDSVWVGDSIFAKPRLDAMVLLGAIAARTTRVRIGPACFASTPLRNPLLLAYQWASLDLLSGGRTVFVACQGQAEPGGGAFEKEFAQFGIEPSSRMRRMEEAIEILRLTSSSENVDYDGEYWRFRNLTVLPRPVQQPIPIWVTANPDLNKKRNAEQAYRRVARLGDGWMTTFKSPAEAQTSLAMIREYAREMGNELKPDFEVAIYHNINIDEDRDRAFAEAKQFLDSYYSVDYRQDMLKLWVAAGSPAQCVQSLQSYVEAGATTILLRVAGYDQKRQFKRVTEEILPAFSLASHRRRAAGPPAATGSDSEVVGRSPITLRPHGSCR
jgi:alkanesulfonate monooxygenase SsuD/methylene tetrahydromethanopterin reductase-like flavin-dependent oxidoreductase (luciferase family)